MPFGCQREVTLSDLAVRQRCSNWYSAAFSPGITCSVRAGLIAQDDCMRFRAAPFGNPGYHNNSRSILSSFQHDHLKDKESDSCRIFPRWKNESKMVTS